MDFILISLFVGVVITVIGELYYYGKPDFFTKTFSVIFVTLSISYFVGLGDIVLSQLDKDIGTTTYHPVANMSVY